MSRRFQANDRRAGASSGTSTAAAYPTPDWRVRSDDALYSAGKVTTIPAVIGPTLTATTGAEPLQNGPVLNGHPSIIFATSGTRLEYAGTVVAAGPGTSDTYSFVAWKDNDVGIGDREYPLYWWNNTAASSSHLVPGAPANIVGFDQYGVYAGDSWRGIGARPSARPVVVTYRRNGGTTSVFVNGVSVGTPHVGASAAHTYTYPMVGASYGTIPVTQWTKGAWYGHDFWANLALSDAQILAHATEMMTRYGITGTEYYPSDNASSLTMWVDSRGKRDILSGQWTGTATLSQWDDQSGNSRILVQGTPGLYPSEGTRINGRPTILTGATAWMAGSNVQGTLTAASGAAYSVMAVIRPQAITATQATLVDRRDAIFGDAGDYWNVGAFTDTGTPSISVYHYGGATYQVKDSGIAVGTPVLVHVWYDGTNLNLRVGNRTAVSITAASLGPATAFRLGFSNASANKFAGDIGDVIFRNAANATHMNQDRAYLGTIYNVAY